MDRRAFLNQCALLGLAFGGVGFASGCRGYQFGHVLKPGAKDLVGSHTAGAEVYDPLVEECVAKLLGRQIQSPQVDYDGNLIPKTVCFVGVENKSAEELGDFKDQIYQQIDTKIVESDMFRPISRRMVTAALSETRLRPDSLMVPSNMRLFTAVLEREGQPIDYLMYATVTSGTTERNKSSQRDYLLTLEMINVNDGSQDKQSAEVSKGYHKTVAGKAWHYSNWFTR